MRHECPERERGENRSDRQEHCSSQEDESSTLYQRPSLERVRDVIELEYGQEYSGTAHRRCQCEQHESCHRSVHASARLSDCRSTKGMPCAPDYTPLFRLWIIFR